MIPKSPGQEMKRVFLSPLTLPNSLSLSYENCSFLKLKYVPILTSPSLIVSVMHQTSGHSFAEGLSLVFLVLSLLSCLKTALRTTWKSVIGSKIRLEHFTVPHLTTSSHNGSLIPISASTTAPVAWVNINHDLCWTWGHRPRIPHPGSQEDHKFKLNLGNRAI